MAGVHRGDVRAAGAGRGCALLLAALSLLAELPGGGAKKLTAMERMWNHPNYAFQDYKKPGTEYDSASTPPSSEDTWHKIEDPPLLPGQKLKKKYRATERIKPPHWIRSEDPDHPNMRIYIDERNANTANMEPENTYWKDHDSNFESGDGMDAVRMCELRNSSEASDFFWQQLEGFDVEGYRDHKYEATAERYGLQDINKFDHMIPKLWFEPPSTASEEEVMREFEADAYAPHGKDVQPHDGHPFCVKCEMLLGVGRPELGLAEDWGDARCRFCGFLNLADPKGRLLNEPLVDALELPPADMMLAASRDAITGYMNRVDEINPEDTVEMRRETEQRCEACGHKRAYYWTAQTRSADEG
eukprot:CAMPEP_0206238182 /NCGR_PEP_ID=MMETSP0047_2-20121206/14679_1 /ASSEMBLY_ACC=CAM_ASM_000192 /TAXON_ID=195065 /ORGANISM="Chroomonas mesostigmatica_cf, Strain CCMP1168" /LENGTH=357 /DNA_ID=CAMNT_0053662701 /DNA_START=43 /DNA_END=1113 /DNA_ORIENTATION=-